MSTIGPYFANAQNNDSETMKNIVYNHRNEFRNWLCSGDVLVVYRGCRDSLTLLDNQDYKAYKRMFVNKNQTQFSITEANETRLTTKVRWMVESINGRIKQWKIFDKVMHSILFPLTSDYFSIVCALINYFSSNFVHDTCKDEAIAVKMLQLLNNSNALKHYIDNLKCTSEGELKWHNLDAAHALNDSCIFSYETLMNLTLGIFQLKQPKPYPLQRLDVNGAFDIKILNLEIHLLRARIQSRHSSLEKHNLWI